MIAINLVSEFQELAWLLACANNVAHYLGTYRMFSILAVVRRDEMLVTFPQQILKLKPNDGMKSRLLFIFLASIFYVGTVNQQARSQTMDLTVLPIKNLHIQAIRNWMQLTRKHRSVSNAISDFKKY